MGIEIEYRLETCGDGFTAQLIDTEVKVYGETVNEAIKKLSDAVRQVRCESA